jgi:flagellin
MAMKGVLVGAENIQAAESVIRDTDMAEQMVEFVKNSILVQSATAMLAQANLKPQAVLQLLSI